MAARRLSIAPKRRSSGPESVSRRDSPPEDDAPRSRGYRQFCGLARALDAIGSRWTLLIIRELLISPRRYSDLKTALPGVASNLLTARLRELKRSGLVRLRDVPPPTPARLYELTPLGCDLEEAVLSLTRWGGHQMSRGRGEDAFRADWLVLALRALLGRDASPFVSNLTATLHVEGESVTIIVAEGLLDVRLGASADADVTMRSDPETTLAVAAGTMPLEQAIAIGRARVEGTARGRRGVATLFAGKRSPPSTLS